MSTEITISRDSRKFSPKKVFIFIVLLGVLGGGGYLWYRSQTPATTVPADRSTMGQTGQRGTAGSEGVGFAAGEPIPVQGTVFTANVEPNRQGIEISGNLKPGKAEDLTFPAAGTIVSLPVIEGQSINQGQILARLDSDDLQYQIASREYEIEQERLTGSPRRLELMEMQYALLVKQLSDYTLTAPISGKISTVSVEPGTSVTRGQAAVRIIDTSTYSATVQVDELDIPKVQLGQEVEVFLDALDGVILYGRVTSIGLEGTATGNGYAVIPVTLRFSDPNPRIMPGFSFSGSILVSAEEEAIVLDRRAVQAIREPLGIVYIVDSESNRATPTTVHYEAFGQLNYRITAGIEPGTQVMQPPSTGAAGTNFPTFRIPGAQNTGGLPGAGATGTRTAAPAGRPQ